MDDTSGGGQPNDQELLARLKQAEELAAHRTEQLIASTSQAYSFLDNIHKGFIMCDTTAEVVLTNQALRNILSLKDSADGTPSELADVKSSLTIDTLNELFGAELGLRDLVEDCLQGNRTIERNSVNFGKRVLKIYLTPLVNSAGSSLGVVVLLEDITQEAILNRSKDEFLSIASHELRTPLTAIRGNSSLIMKHYAESINNPDLSEMIADIHEASIRLIGIVNDFLDVAALEQGKINMQSAPFSLDEVVTDAIKETEPLCAEKGVALVKDGSIESSPPIYADKQRIKQVVINLIGNAIKFTDQGSITLSAGSDDKFVEVSVTDTGRGMSEESQKLLFHKFQQAGSDLLTRDTTKGTGLGLYISKLIVELSGGKIGLKSSVIGQGSTFAFSLPQSPNQ